MDAALQQLIDERDVRDVVTKVFVGTDRRDWKLVEDCLSDPVTLDMTSVAGGAPARLKPSEVTARWAAGLKTIDHVHHQLGNFLIEIVGDSARASCYAIGLHHRKVADPLGVRRFVGSYDVRLSRRAGRWTIDLFKIDLAFVDGNLELETAT
jgi:SnoaL-like protein